ncbi:MAG: DUF2231 domain-containing protein [Gemmatimonadaceae bacterium]
MVIDPSSPRRRPADHRNAGRRRIAAPLHPIFAHFTIALTASSLGFDAAGKLFGVPSLAAAGWWTLALALAATTGTLATGIVSRMRLAVEEGAARSYLRAHMALGPAFLGLLLAAAAWRAALREGERVPSWSYLLALALVVCVMAVQGYLGGELVYRFGAEVRGTYPRMPGHRGGRLARPEPGTTPHPATGRGAGSA